MGIVSVVSVSGRDDCQLCSVSRVFHHIAHNGTRLLDDWAVVINVCHIHSHLQQRYYITLLYYNLIILEQHYHCWCYWVVILVAGCNREALLDCI